MKKKIKFLIVGLVNTAFGYGLYSGLLFLDISYQIALLVATVVGIIFNYFTFGYAVFDGGNGFKIFGKFIAAYSFIYFSNISMLSVLIGWFYFNPYVAQLLCMPVGVLLSWILMNYFVFKNNGVVEND